MNSSRFVSIKIRQLRLRKGYSQEAVAHLLEISQNGYQKIECGKSNLKVDTLLQLAEILEVPAYSFFVDDATTLPADGYYHTWQRQAAPAGKSKTF